MRRYALHDEQWERIEGLLPGREGHVGVTAKDNRLFVEAVLYRYRAGIAWRDLPERFGFWIWQESLVRFGKSLVHLTNQWPPLAEAPALRAGLGISFAPSFHRATKAVTVGSRLDDVGAVGDPIQ
jgi:transposase